MVDTKQIRALLRANFRIMGKVTIDENYKISVTGDVKLKKAGVISPEIQFLEVTGNFECRDNPRIQSLRGAPQIVGSWLICDNNPELTSLEGGPKSVGNWVWLVSNPQLATLDHFPEHIGGRVTVTYTKTLPLLRTLVAKQGVSFAEGHNRRYEMPPPAAVVEILNRYKGQGQSAAVACAAALAEAGFKANARW